MLMLFAVASCTGEKGSPSDQADADSGLEGNDNDASVSSECPRYEGWDDLSHSTDGEANYAVVFPKGKVNRLDITVSGEDWKLMLDNLDEIISGLSADPNSQEPVPPFLTEPCEGKEIRESCEFFVPGLPGVCANLGPSQGCLPLYAGEGAGDAMVEGKPIYVKSTVVFEGKTWQHVGLRFKGNASLAFTWKEGVHKLPLKLDFDEFEDEHCDTLDQRFFGFKRLSLSNNMGDDSNLREKVAGEIFLEAGVPAPRSAFYRVFLDFGEGSKYMGLYTMVEVPAKPLLAREFGDKDGNLYKPEGRSASWSSFHEDSFGKRSNELEGDWSDIIGAFNALHADRSDPAKWRAGLEGVFDVHGFLKCLAVMTVIQNWDTYGNMVQNYYLYTSSTDGLVHWIPWDNNSAFTEVGLFPALSLGQDEVTDFFPLIRFLLDDPVYRSTYVSFLEDVVSGPYEATRAKKLFEEEMQLIKPYIVGPDGEQAGFTLLADPSDFDAEYQRLLKHTDERKEAVAQFLAEEE